MMRLRSFFPRYAMEAPGEPGGGEGGPWYVGKPDATPEMIGYLQSRGWDKDPTAAAFGAAKAHQEANKFLGVPADQLVRIPKKEDTASWEQVWQRFGKPADAKEYDFSGVKRADGSALPDSLVGALRVTASRLNLPKESAPLLAKDLLQVMDTATIAEKAEREQKLAEEHDKLADAWKAGFHTNMLVAKRTAAALGINETQIQALEKVAGYASVMQMLRQLGTLAGEDKHLIAPGGNTPGRMTREMAMSKIAELSVDTAYMQRYLNGGVVEKKEMGDLHTAAYGA